VDSQIGCKISFSLIPTLIYLPSNISYGQKKRENTSGNMRLKANSTAMPEKI